MGTNGNDSGLAADITAHTGVEARDDPETLDVYSRDASIFVVRPKAVVYPKDVQEVGALVRYAREKTKAGIPIHLTARSAGTDMSGGPLSDSVVVDMRAHFNRFIECSGESAVVEPGMLFRDFDAQTATRGLELPSYTASRELCTVGGMVANNSGGEKNLMYGKTAQYVAELRMVLADGEEYLIRPVPLSEARTGGSDFLSHILADVAHLIEAHQGVIERARPKVSKNSSGFALWDVVDSNRQMFDLTRIISGSQGTLGIITQIRFRLVRPKVHKAMTVIFLNNIAELGRMVPRVMAFGPESFESYDDHTFALGVRYFPEFAAQMKTGLIKMGIEFLPEMWMMAKGGVPKLVLLAEFTADSQAEAVTKAEAASRAVEEEFGVQTKVGHNADESRKYWAVRHESFNLLRKKVRGMRTAPFIDDFVVPPIHLSEFLPRLESILSNYPITYTIAGHIGDGNFHIIPLMDMTNPDVPRVIDELSHAVYELVLSYDGSISGEHNDGIVRGPYVKEMFGDEMYALFEELERIFDPLGIFNPGKKTGVSFEAMISRIDTANQ